MKRFLWLGFVLFSYLICSGCGDTFRPIIIPNPPTFPNPKAAHTTVSINDNGDIVAGSAMVIDVSGDTNVSTADVSIHPVHAVQQTANQVLVVNQAVVPIPKVPTTSCLITSNGQTLNVCPSLTKLNFNGTTINTTNAISMPIYSGANFVGSTPLDTTAYVTLPTFPPDPTSPATIVPSVAVVNLQSNSVTATIAVGNNPVALAVTPDKNKLYVANEGDSTISGFNTSDRSQRTGSPVHTTSPPIWLSARNDSQRVFVLEESGTLATLDTTSTAGPDIFTESGISVPGASTMVYDSNLNRLYIPGGGVVAIVDISQSLPQLLGGGAIVIPTAVPGARGSADPCSQTNPQPLIVAAAAALPDGSRAYVGAYYEDASNNICPQVTVIDAKSNTIKNSVAIPGFPAFDTFCSGSRFRITMAAGGDSSRAYLASCDGGNVNMIDTATDSYILNLPAPVGTRPPINPNPQNQPQNPVFLIAGP